ncbi:hypothetical protein [Polaribacter ponticola]|uniref:Uncharacterized protein n=1 Tax=Polaribacter ponticola TaxID=2978475 RepID=A0ABT5S564_9FLAO|nr:hypothetical protein [Polaribacter sp. MSW5]MDD7913244.1 hypothetical protein [Polaribacter sp. MSW5]
MKKSINLFILCFFISIFSSAQQNSISIKSTFNPETDELNVQQEIVYINSTEVALNNIYLHNWGNSFRDRKTPLSKRFIKDFKKTLYFSKKKTSGKPL